MAKSSQLHNASIQRHFRALTDPRTRTGKIKHPLINIVVMALCATIAGANDSLAIAAFARARTHWFAKFLNLPRAEDGSLCTPSHDTFERVLSLIDPIEFQKCLIHWTQDLHDLTKGKIIAIDGKVVREAMKRANDQGPLTLVSAWASEQSLVLAQVAGPEGSNELGALPELLRLLDLSGAIVTIDAIGCQKNLVEQIVNAKGDFVISVKSNQDTLHGVVLETFAKVLDDANGQPPENSETTVEKSHGRTDTRTVTVVPAPNDYPDKELWRGVKSFVMVHRTSLDKNGNETTGTRYFISSLASPSAKTMASIVRNHWSVESGLHWQLDVTFREDKNRARTGALPSNLGILRRTALSLIKNGSDGKKSVSLMRQTAGWDENVLEKVVFGPKIGEP